MIPKDNRQNVHQEINHIFQDLFPFQGMAERPAQIALSHRMLDAILDGHIALCDAGTGIGKTYAYLAAGVVFHRFRAAMGTEPKSLLISTSSIALQSAILNEYLPLLSRQLMADGLLDSPVRAVIRKGKSHYVCDERLVRRLRNVDLSKKNKLAADALLSMKDHLDLDAAEYLSSYDRERVCVPEICDCKREECRYRRFLADCDSGHFHFQICNHNLLLADAIHRGTGKRPLFPEYGGVIIDEAHKLPETARQMFGVTLTAEDLRALIHGLRAERYVLAADNLAEAAKPLLQELSQPWEETKPISHYIRLLAGPEKTLATIQRQLGGLLPPVRRIKLDRLAGSVTLFRRGSAEMVFYTAEDEQGGTMLCATITDLTGQLRSVLWRQRQPIILASGTLAVGGDFRRFKEETGLMADGRVVESVAPSPFDYKKNCLLYLPQFPPRYSGGDYCGELAEETAALLDATHGHALALFTSYAAMSSVAERLRKLRPCCTLFALGRNADHTMEQFKDSPGSVLLATGAAWEGFDFPGDCVSLLIIPRLPFPLPDALKEKERENYASLKEFLRAVAVPEMQIKLRQGFGRAIRTETDTCVVAILDERAARGHRYHQATRAALPEMPVTGSLNTVEGFIRRVKAEGYFREGAA